MSTIANVRIMARRIYNSIPSPIRRRLTPFLASSFSKLAVYKETSFFLGERRISGYRTLIRQGKVKEAFEAIGREIDEHNPNLRLLDMYAETAFQLGEKDTYDKISQKILQIDPLNIKALKRLISNGRNYEVDIEKIKTHLVSKNDIKIFINASEFLLHSGNIEDCVNLCDQGIELVRSKHLGKFVSEEITSKFLLIKGHALSLKHDWEGAEFNLSCVKPKTSSHGKAAFLRARAMLEQDQPEEALSLIEDQFRNGGRKIGFHVTYFASLLRLNKIREAYSLYRLRPTSVAVAKYFGQEAMPNALHITAPSRKRLRALLLSEFGPGDEIRFSSIYSRFSGIFGQTCITCDPRLTTILQRTFPDIQFIPAERYRREMAGNSHSDRLGIGQPLLRNFVSEDVVQAAKDKDVVCTVLDTLGELLTDRDAFRRQRSRYKVEENLAARWKKQMAGRANLQVGLAWRSLLLSPDRDRHYLKAEDLSALSQVEGVDFWVLQAGVTEQELRFLSERMRIIVPDVDLKDDFEGQAALLSNLDVTIAPMTTMAELAGMVDSKTLIFCRTPEVIWRRNGDGTDVWFDNARIVAADPIHDVSGLVDSLVRELIAARAQR